MNKSHNNGQKRWLGFLMYMITLCLTGFISYQYGCSFKKIFLLEIVILASYILALFSYCRAYIYDELNFDNKYHVTRFAVAYLLGLMICIAFPIFPSNGWVFPVIALALSLYSNQMTGILVYTQMLTISAIISNADITLVLIYLLSGIMFVILFDKMDKDYKIGLPLFIAIVLYGCAIIAYSYFNQDSNQGYEFLIVPIINIFITILLMLAILRIVCATIIDKEKGEYIDINDQEFCLLIKYKESNPELYYNAIHTAYFTEKIARALQLDIDLAKNGGYYHKIIPNECKESNEKIDDICERYHFPKKAVTLLKELNYKSKDIRGRETAVVYLVESVISSIIFLMKKEEQKDVDYGKVAVAIMKRRIDSGVLKNSDITLKDITEMENIFLGEKLYYDFLRRE